MPTPQAENPQTLEGGLPPGCVAVPLPATDERGDGVRVELDGLRGWLVFLASLPPQLSPERAEELGDWLRMAEELGPPISDAVRARKPAIIESLPGTLFDELKAHARRQESRLRAEIRAGQPWWFSLLELCAELAAAIASGDQDRCGQAAARVAGVLSRCPAHVQKKLTPVIADPASLLAEATCISDEEEAAAIRARKEQPRVRLDSGTRCLYFNDAPCELRPAAFGHVERALIDPKTGAKKTGRTKLGKKPWQDVRAQLPCASDIFETRGSETGTVIVRTNIELETG